MKTPKLQKVLMVLAAIALLSIIIGMLPNMIGLGIGVLLALWAGSKFTRSSVMGKIGYGLLVAIGAGTALSNIWAVIGIAAAVLLYVGYMKMKAGTFAADDLFRRRRAQTTSHFEAEWKDLKNTKGF
ncbi:lmo0954 family membrane protein [Exiguobacterium flavidum]|uniref:lmo0954 family membrane protein n=1 Tax=Exiguobacterium flavidum TaxID=2184695 RepID=UPI000DF7559C|nr:hypothetical protein [Exiguobacterium flavidum]